MAGEIQCSFSAGKNLYALIRSATGMIWNGSSFESYLTANYANYPITMTEQGSASGFYTATFPATIVPGVYSIVVKERAGGSPAESDATIAEGNFQWSGTVSLPLSDLATSGQLGAYLPSRIARGVMILNYPIYMKSAADHITPFTSGIISGQISRNGGGFSALQSGAFTELGNGWYSLQALTSGDLAANTVALLFTGAGISGGTSDPLPISMVLQRTSGQTIT